MCAITGIKNHSHAAHELYDSLVHLQHRGQDAAGIVTCDKRLYEKRSKGLVRDIFNEQDMEYLQGNIGIAHTRYPTSGAPSHEEAQPFWIGSPYGIALAHNGNLVNDKELKKQLRQNRRRHLNTDNDSETLLHLFADGFMDQTEAASSEQFFEQICQSVEYLYQNAQGAYSLVATIVGWGLVGIRDPHGVRPLCLGKRTNDHEQQDVIISSEPTPFYSLGYQLEDNLAAGEVVFVDTAGQIFRRQLTDRIFAPCIFEYVYFARPDAILDDVSVYRARLRMGRYLAQHWQNTYPELLPDVVIPVPYTANTAALSFAHTLGIRYSEGLYKNPFIGRTFIMAGQSQRRRSVRFKLNPQSTEIADKKVLLVDDSIVRGTTSREIVRMVRDWGAKQVYLASTAPPLQHPCYYGIDIPDEEELIANDKTQQQIQDYLEVDALLYQSLHALLKAVTRRGEHNIERPCMACMDGYYTCGKPILTDSQQQKDRHESIDHR